MEAFFEMMKCHVRASYFVVHISAGESREIHGGGRVVTFLRFLSASINRNNKWTYILSKSCPLQNSYSYKHMAIKTHPKWIFLKLN